MREGPREDGTDVRMDEGTRREGGRERERGGAEGGRARGRKGGKEGGGGRGNYP